MRIGWSVSNLLVIAKDWAGGQEFVARRHLSWVLLGQCLEVEWEELQAEASAQEYTERKTERPSTIRTASFIQSEPSAKRKRRKSSAQRQEQPTHLLIATAIQGL
jgi:hypothetical protein